jgi:hypothetical protein
MRWLVAVAPLMRGKNLPWCRTVLNDVTNLTTIVAGVRHYAHLPWWWGQHGFGGGAMALGMIFSCSGGQVVN